MRLNSGFCFRILIDIINRNTQRFSKKRGRWCSANGPSFVSCETEKVDLDRRISRAHHTLAVRYLSSKLKSRSYYRLLTKLGPILTKSYHVKCLVFAKARLEIALIMPFMSSIRTTIRCAVERPIDNDGIRDPLGLSLVCDPRPDGSAMTSIILMELELSLCQFADRTRVSSAGLFR
jgi:hypothetical protein